MPKTSAQVSSFKINGGKQCQRNYAQSICCWKSIYLAKHFYKEKYGLVRNDKTKNLSQIHFSRYIFKNQDKVDESGPWDSNPGLSQLNHDSSNVCKSIVV